MLKIHQLFFFNYLILIISAIVVGGGLLFVDVKKHEESLVEERLKQSIDLISAVSKNTDLNALQNYFLASQIRATLINFDGTVAFDSQKDAKTMQNHSDRIEIKEAGLKEFGKSIRFSQTIGLDLMYVAKHLQINNQMYTLRLSMPISKIDKNAFSFWFDLVFYLMLLILAGVIITHFVNQKISNEVKSLILIGNAFSQKTYPSKDKKFFIQELHQIYKTLLFSGTELKKRDKKKRKSTAKIKLKNKQLQDMLNALSHEFKNPIAVIKGFVETIHKDTDLDVELRQRFLEKIHTQALKLNEMIDRFSLASRLESKALSLEITEFNLQDLVQELVSNTHTERKINLALTECKIKADRTLFEIIVKNLIDNALKYSSDEINISLKNSCLCVSDKGSGIEEEEIENITKKFYRVSKLGWNNSMGLGLFIVNYALKLHNLKLDITSQIGKGSTFSIDLNA